MPGTPLLDRIAAAFALAGHAERSGLTPAQLLEEARAPGLASVSRRRFLGASAAGLALAACEGGDPLGVVPEDGPNHSRVRDGDARVVVVGAGLAGLTCAWRLRQKGVVAAVHEGSQRLGGRCWTLRGYFAEGQIAERGGELIDQGHQAIRQLAQELGLPLDNVLAAEANHTHPLYWFGGAPYSLADAAADLKSIWQPLHRDAVQAGYPTLHDRSTPRGRQLDHTTLAQWIDATVPGGRTSRLGRLLETAYVIEYGADAEQQSALNLIYLLAYRGPGQVRIFGASNEKYHVRGGNDQIVSRLAERLDGQVTTGSRLVAIARTAAGAYDLTFEEGASTRTERADHVVLALPFPMLREVDWDTAGFDALKRTAIEALRMGANAKLNVQFTGRPWRALGCNGDSFAETGYQATWEVSRAQPGTAGILVNYTGGGVALAQSGGAAAALAAAFLGQIEPVLPGLTAAANGLASFDGWDPTTPWVKGSYAYWGPGDYTRFAGAEGARSGNCHFAGEHTSIDFQGYLNGAVESGERAAAEVVATLRGKAAA